MTTGAPPSRLSLVIFAAESEGSFTLLSMRKWTTAR
jgi:hypothetical protein